MQSCRIWFVWHNWIMCKLQAADQMVVHVVLVNICHLKTPQLALITASGFNQHPFWYTTDLHISHLYMHSATYYSAYCYQWIQQYVLYRHTWQGVHCPQAGQWSRTAGGKRSVWEAFCYTYLHIGWHSLSHRHRLSSLPQHTQIQTVLIASTHTENFHCFNRCSYSILLILLMKINPLRRILTFHHFQIF